MTGERLISAAAEGAATKILPEAENAAAKFAQAAREALGLEGQNISTFLPRSPGLGEYSRIEHSWTDLKTLRIDGKNSNASPDKHWYIPTNVAQLPEGWTVAGRTVKSFEPSYFGPAAERPQISQFFPKMLNDNEGYGRVAINLRLHAFDKGEAPLSVIDGSWSINTRYGQHLKFSDDGKSQWREVFDRTAKDPLFQEERQISQSLRAFRDRNFSEHQTKALPSESSTDWLNKHFPDWKDWRAYW